jgi:hypothetical protein
MCYERIVRIGSGLWTGNCPGGSHVREQVLTRGQVWEPESWVVGRFLQEDECWIHLLMPPRS